MKFLGGPRLLQGLIVLVVFIGALPALSNELTGDSQAGRSLVASRQKGLCLLCHSGPFPEEPFQGNIAPNLSDLVANLSATQLRARIMNPAITNPQTIMPSYYQPEHLTRVSKPYQGQSILSLKEIDDVVAYLMTLKKE
ncbi:MAG: sulfur oxidation c-type cytochrome SoxX [Polynucleobacter sp.]|jgi:sulfur-oxidizing protein SoxX|nr:sulfur oxidation c-type cytochrome SoxX [Polynucleobacter sp.]